MPDCLALALANVSRALRVLSSVSLESLRFRQQVDLISSVSL